MSKNSFNSGLAKSHHKPLSALISENGTSSIRCSTVSSTIIG